METSQIKVKNISANSAAICCSYSELRFHYFACPLLKTHSGTAHALISTWSCGRQDSQAASAHSLKGNHYSFCAYAAMIPACGRTFQSFIINRSALNNLDILLVVTPGIKCTATPPKSNLCWLAAQSAAWRGISIVKGNLFSFFKLCQRGSFYIFIGILWSF